MEIFSILFNSSVTSVCFTREDKVVSGSDDRSVKVEFYLFIYLYVNLSFIL